MAASWRKLRTTINGGDFFDSDNVTFDADASPRRSDELYGISTRLFVNNQQKSMAREIEIEVIKRETVKPSSPTPENSRRYEFSSLDQYMPTLPGSVLLSYPPTARIMSVSETSQFLIDSLSKTMTSFHHFAGQYSTDGVAVHCNDEGAGFVATRVNIVDVPNPSGRGAGYRYFGAAKKLPGVRELFEKPPELRKWRTRYDIYKRIDASYYGYRDDEDGVLDRVEAPAEVRMRAAAAAEWQRMEEIRVEARRALKSGEVAMVAAVAREVLFEEEEEVVEEERRERELKERNESEREFVVHVPLPEEKEIERIVMEKKKTELLSKYTIFEVENHGFLSYFALDSREREFEFDNSNGPNGQEDI